MKRLPLNQLFRFIRVHKPRLHHAEPWKKINPVVIALQWTEKTDDKHCCKELSQPVACLCGCMLLPDTSFGYSTITTNHSQNPPPQALKGDVGRMGPECFQHKLQLARPHHGSYLLTGSSESAWQAHRWLDPKQCCKWSGKFHFLQTLHHPQKQNRKSNSLGTECPAQVVCAIRTLLAGTPSSSTHYVPQHGRSPCWHTCRQYLFQDFEGEQVIQQIPHLHVTLKHWPKLPGTSSFIVNSTCLWCLWPSKVFCLAEPSPLRSDKSISCLWGRLQPSS